MSEVNWSETLSALWRHRRWLPGHSISRFAERGVLGRVITIVPFDARLTAEFHVEALRAGFTGALGNGDNAGLALARQLGQPPTRRVAKLRVERRRVAAPADLRQRLDRATRAIARLLARDILRRHEAGTAGPTTGYAVGSAGGSPAPSEG